MILGVINKNFGQNVPILSSSFLEKFRGALKEDYLKLNGNGKQENFTLYKPCKMKFRATARKLINNKKVFLDIKKYRI